MNEDQYDWDELIQRVRIEWNLHKRDPAEIMAEALSEAYRLGIHKGRQVREAGTPIHQDECPTCGRDVTL